MAKVNFTAEHKLALDVFILSKIYSGETFKGKVGASSLTMSDLMNCTVNELKERHASLKTQIEKLEKTDESLMSDYEERKLKKCRADAEGLILLIRYKAVEEEKETNRKKASELRNDLNRLVEENKTPAERIAEMTAKLAEYENEY